MRSYSTRKVQPVEGGLLAVDLLLEPFRRGPDGLVEESQEQLVLAGEVLVELRRD